GDAIVTEGFTNWRKRERLQVHVGAHDSAHNIALGKCLALMNEKSHIAVALSKQTNEAQIEYRTRLTASIDVIRLLLRQGLPFRGHDESEKSKNQGNFLEFLEFLSDHNESIQKVVLTNAPENLKLTSPQIQKDIVSAIASEIRETIISEIGDGLFSILIDESRDVSVKEQMAIVLRYVDDKGCVMYTFLFCKTWKVCLTLLFDKITNIFEFCIFIIFYINFKVYQVNIFFAPIDIKSWLRHCWL
ncbi:DUF4371 domain-containing protein, partial [Cephalotus follicularis]